MPVKDSVLYVFALSQLEHDQTLSRSLGKCVSEAGEAEVGRHWAAGSPERIPGVGF